MCQQKILKTGYFRQLVRKLNGDFSKKIDNKVAYLCSLWCCGLKHHLSQETTASFKSKSKADDLVYKMDLKFGKPTRSLRSVSQQLVSI